MIMTEPVNYLIDADIKGFFDNVSHEWMLKFLRHRIDEESTIRLISRIMRAGYIEEGTFFDTTVGTPQGGIISPMLANIVSAKSTAPGKISSTG
jgi:retron-type reverse transcriptase